MNMDNALQTFIAEGRELLEAMEQALLALGQPEAGAGEHIAAIFRGAHTIKGSAGLFGLEHIVAFTHGVESVLDRARDGRLAIDDELVVLLLSCCDHLAGALDAVDGGRLEPTPDESAQAAALAAQLTRYLPVDDGAAEAGAAPATDPTVAAGATGAAAPAPAADSGRGWHLSLRFAPDVLRNGLDPLGFIRYLTRLGRITGLRTVDDALPAAEAMDPESCHLGFEIALESEASKAEIESVFEFIADDCTLRILPPGRRVEDFVALIDALPEAPLRLGEILLACGSLTDRELQAALAAQAAQALGAPPRPGWATCWWPSSWCRLRWWTRRWRASSASARPPRRDRPRTVRCASMPTSWTG